MAQIDDIVNELNTIATAFTSVNKFIFDEVSAINEDRSKTYPAILVDSRNIVITPVSLNRSNLPHRVTYGLKLFFLDTYHVSEQKTTNRQTKYAEMETIANQYLAEVQSRTLDNNKGFHLKDKEISGFVVDKVHNDDLAQLVYDVRFTAYNDCNTGSFSY